MPRVVPTPHRARATVLLTSRMMIRDAQSCSLDVGAPRHSRVLICTPWPTCLSSRVPQTALAV
eukprot:1526367-Prymnesium_polylepis.1